MNMAHKMRRSLKILTALIGGLIGIGMIGVGTVYTQQDLIIDEVVAYLNEGYEGRLEIEDSHISPFRNFPYISIDLENIRVYESKAEDSELLLDIADTYLGFDFWSILDGSYNVKRISLENGFIKLVQHPDGTFNLANALSHEEDTETDEATGHLDLQAIRLINIDLLKLNEENDVLVEAFVEDAFASLKTTEQDLQVSMDSDFVFNLIIEGDTSFLHHKHVALETSFAYHNETNILELNPSEIYLEKALFMMEGSIDVEDNLNLDLTFSGSKPNFDLFLSFLPEEVTPLLSRYENGGRIYFDAIVSGPSINGHAPKIDIDFGCEAAFVHNMDAGKEINDLFFEGHFSNGELRSPETMMLTIQDFSARPETGTLTGELLVKNFASPEIDLQVITEFNLDFLADFLNIQNLQDVTGEISLEMNFHDIVDLDSPEKSIEKLNESYFTRLEVNNLNFIQTDLPWPVKDVNVQVTMDGHEAIVKQLDFKLGNTDMAIQASISDLPAILHHTDIPVDAVLDIRSTQIDLQELTFNPDDSTSSFNDQIRNFSTHFTFNSSARAFTESPNLPLGEFIIDNLNAEFANYPHRLHDFSADMFVDSANFRVIDFTGMIDSSDFHFNGKLENYDLWFEKDPTGITGIDFNLTSKLIQLEDLFSYNGENHVPEDYRHEEFRNLKIHGLARLEFDKKLTSTDIVIDRVEANMKIHPMRFQDFKGEVHLDSSSLEVKNFSGTLGNSKLSTNFSYYFGPDSLALPYTLSITGERLDFDQLFQYNPPPATGLTPEQHEAGFNIFEVPFANINFDMQIDHVNYHRVLLDDFSLKGRMQENHYLYVDTMHFAAAGGKLGLNGYFNGSDPKAIYFSPNIQAQSIDLDKLLFKFENFGQDHLVSENLHGDLSGNLSGKIHMHADMVPIIDDSELHIEVEVLDGSLNNYAAFEALSDYFADKNLNNVRFDTLRNTFDLKGGVLTIPNMNINTSLGYFEISGQQSMDLNMDYYIRVPVKLVVNAGVQKLFGKKETRKADQVDEIQYRDMTRRVRFVNLRIEGTPENYKVTIGAEDQQAGAEE